MPGHQHQTQRQISRTSRHSRRKRSNHVPHSKTSPQHSHSRPNTKRPHTTNTTTSLLHQRLPYHTQTKPKPPNQRRTPIPKLRQTKSRQAPNSPIPTTNHNQRHNTHTHHRLHQQHSTIQKNSRPLTVPVPQQSSTQ